MSSKQLDQQHWSSVLAKESGPPFDRLIGAYETLSQSPDSSMQLAAAWALLYASMKDHPDATEAFRTATESLDKLSVSRVVKLYGWTNNDIPLRAAVTSALAPQIRSPKVVHDTVDRATIYQGLLPVLERAVKEAEAGSPNAQGVLGELVIAALCWRPVPEVFSVLNTVPAGPMKDSRGKHIGRFNTDLYAYHPTLKSTLKGRANLQIKTTFANSKRVYDPNAIIVIGLDEAVYCADEDWSNGREASLWLGRTLMKDMSGEALDLHDEKALFYTIADVYDRVDALAEAKRERAETRS